MTTPDIPTGPALDAALALALGWRFQMHGHEPPIFEWIPPAGQEGGPHLPPFSTSWEEAGRLAEAHRLAVVPLEEGGRQLGWVAFPGGHDPDLAYFEACPMQMGARAPTGPEAIARAVLAMLGGGA